MARIRTIKPEFWTDSKIVELSYPARLLFIGSWNFTMCDDGHLPADPMALKLKVMPADPVDPIELVDELVQTGVMNRGSTTDGRPYLHVPKLREHQKVDDRWKPRCFVCAAQGPAETPLNSPEHPETRPVKERKGRTTTSTADASDDRFNEFWASYPRKVNKQDALRTWTKATKDVDPQVIINGVKSFDFTGDPKFIPHPATWLTNRRWEDEKPTGRIEERLMYRCGPDQWRELYPDEVVDHSNLDRYEVLQVEVR